MIDYKNTLGFDRRPNWEECVEPNSVEFFVGRIFSRTAFPPSSTVTSFHVILVTSIARAPVDKESKIIGNHEGQEETEGQGNSVMG